MDEWYFSNSFESITKGMTSEEAFNYLPQVIEMLFKLDEDYLIWETLYFLMDLYTIADTTQVHPFLERNWFELTNHIKRFNDSYATPFRELKRHLRITN
ncbi:ABC transporter [Ureibacillus sp. NPDC094379]